MKRILTLILLLSLTLLMSGCEEKKEPEPQEPVFLFEPDPQTGNHFYELDVTLHPEDRKASVKGQIIYYNEIPDLDELYVNFYPKAIDFATRQNTFDLNEFTVDGVDYLDSATWTGPDETALHIDLEETYQNDDMFIITFDYDFTYWQWDRIFASQDEDYFVTMFFYPHVAMFDESGWNIERYTFSGETYYNEVGDYDVTLHIPSEFIVASGGDLQYSYEWEGITNYRYYMEDARDYSFSASTLYSVYTKEINGKNFEIYSIEELSNGQLMQSWSYLENSFNSFEAGVGEYYFDNFVLEYGLIYGMESTGIVYCDIDISEETVVHEVAHMWFFSMIGNDQYDFSFLDESMTTYITAMYFRDLYPIDGYDGYLDSRDSTASRFDYRFSQLEGTSLLQGVDEFSGEYGYIIYYHGPTIVRSYVDQFLGGDVDQFLEILQTYYDTYAKEIATLDNFLDLLETESGVEQTKEWFLLQLNGMQDLTNQP